VWLRGFAAPQLGGPAGADRRDAPHNRRREEMGRGIAVFFARAELRHALPGPPGGGKSAPVCHLYRVICTAWGGGTGALSRGASRPRRTSSRSITELHYAAFRRCAGSGFPWRRAFYSD